MQKSFQATANVRILKTIYEVSIWYIEHSFLLISNYLLPDKKASEYNQKINRKDT